MTQMFAISLILLLPLLSFLFLHIRRPNLKKLDSPPCPPKLPLIGNLHQLGALPHRSLAALSKKHGGLMLLQLGQVPTVIVSSPEIAQEVMRTNDPIFASRPPSKIIKLILHGSIDMAFAPYGEYWRQARKLCVTHLLSSKMLQSFRSLMEEEVASMVSKISNSSNDVVDISEVLVLFSGSIISRVVTGKFSEGGRIGHLLRLVVKENSDVVGAFHPSDFFPAIGRFDILDLDRKAKRVAEKWDEVLAEVIKEQVDRPQSDPSFADILVSLEDDPSSDFPFTRGNINALLIDMFAAGTDTSYSALEWSMAELMHNPAAMAKLQAEVRAVGQGKDMIRDEDLSSMSYLKAVIKEVLRLHPPAPLLVPRESIEDCKVAGYRIAKGTRVIVNAWAIGRDPTSWEEAETFKPERFIDSSVDYKGSDFEFIPFGAGRRICPGMNFAVHTIELALANLVYRFDWGLPGDMRSEELDMSELPGLVTRKKQQLVLVPKPFSCD